MAVIFGPGATLAYAIVLDQQNSGVAPASVSTTNNWNTVRLSTKKNDPTSMVSLAANQITLDAGTYFIWWAVPASNVTTLQTRLRNVTDSTSLVVGLSVRTSSTGAAPTRCICSPGTGVFTVGASKALEIQAYISASGSLGIAASTGQPEIYSMVFLQRRS